MGDENDYPQLYHQNFGIVREQTTHIGKQHKIYFNKNISSIMSKRLTKRTITLFESIKSLDDFGNEYWTSRAMWRILEYNEYRNFLPVIEKAKTACINSSQRIEDHFVDFHEMVGIGLGAERSVDSVKLSKNLAEQCLKIYQRLKASRP